MSNNKNSGEIYIGQISLKIFKFSGTWEPFDLTRRWKLIFYQIYSIFILTIFIIFTLSVCINLFQKHDNIEELSQSLFYSSTVLMTLIKMIILIKRRDIFRKTQKMLMSEICRPRDFCEIEILHNYSLKGRKFSICHLIVVYVAGTMVLSLPLITMSKKLILPIPYWIPFSLETKFVYFLSYLQEIIGVIIIVNINGGMETLALSILLQICGQLEILIYRLNSLSKLTKNNENNNNNNVKYYQEAEITKDCIKSHLYLHAIGENINKQFGILIFMQFFASMILLCIIIYNVSKMSLTNHQSWLMICFAGSYTLQIFIYCYFGQQVTEKSTEIGTATYFINWNSLTLNTKKSLIIIMMRSVRPIKLTASSIIVMSLETFMKIMKTSYSAYNLLKNN